MKKGCDLLIIYVVKKGDTIYQIAEQFGVPVETIIEANGLVNPNLLVVGQALVIPGDFSSQNIMAGQSLYAIARNYGIPLDQLIRLNPQIGNIARLQIGQPVTVPVPPPKLGAIFVNGYAFPSIDPEVLGKTLPYLTYLSIFSYQVRSDGSLKPIDDTPLIEAARNAGVAPMMTITNIEEGASFSGELAHTILTNEEIQDKLIANIIKTLQEKNYYGLDVDFEYLYPEDRQNYNQFMDKVGTAIRPLGYILTVAIAPKITAEQRGTLYEAHDYPAQGALVEHVIIMTYEWGYIRGPAMAVAPIGPVRQVLDYAVSVIPSEKILMGMPNYGYDWTLPFVRGSAARILTLRGAVDLAAKVGADIQFDRVSQAPYFTYYDQNGKKHEVWFEDARSYQARLLLVDEYNLGGVSYWTINSFYPQNWLVLESMYEIIKVL